jgi:hypothetical protein
MMTEQAILPGLANPKRPTRGSLVLRRGTAKAEREDNKLKLDDRAAHQWYRFVLSFPPHLVREYAAKFGLDSHHQVLDPFCGTGTTLVECQKLGIPAFGLEPNPVACFASQTKVHWNIDPQELLRHAMTVAETANRRLEQDGFSNVRFGQMQNCARCPRKPLIYY